MRSDRTYRFDSEPVALWNAISRVDQYRRWWPWLRSFEAGGLEPGDRWRCTVRPPLPYALRFTISLTDVVHPERIAAAVEGDIEGEASVLLRASGTGGCEVRLRSSLEPHRGVLRRVTVAAPWLARFGHDWVLDTGLRQFRREALRR